MTEHLPPTAADTARGLDVEPVLAAMQDQIDDLTAAVETQQRTLDAVVSVLTPAQRATLAATTSAPHDSTP